MNESLYDEAGTRTRQAWTRSGLTVLALCALIARGLHVHGFTGAPMVLAPLPAYGLAILIVLRTRRVRHHESPALERRTSLLILASVIGIAAVALLTVF